MFYQAATFNNVERSEVKEVNHCSSINGRMAFTPSKNKNSYLFFLVRSSVVNFLFQNFL